MGGIAITQYAVHAATGSAGVFENNKRQGVVMLNWKFTVSLFGMVVSAVLGTTSASAYQFGAPPITEITDNGTSRGRNSLFYLVDNGQYTGFSGEHSNGTRFGNSNYMYRLGKSNYNESSGAYSRAETFLGLGKGWQWDITEDRHIGVIGNFQFDYQSWSNSGGSTDKGTGLAYGLEFGGLYRYFMEANTLTSFAMLNLVTTSNSSTHTVRATSAYYDQTGIFHAATAASSVSSTLSEQARALIFGVDYMMGRMSMMGTFALGSGNTSGSKASLMMSVGYNF